MTYYKIEFSEEFKQPLRVTYKVLCPETGVSRKGHSFYPTKGYRHSGPSDYYKNVWDKGHMAPAASFDCDFPSMRSTFTYLNCALQHEKLNRGAWKYLEMHERRLALYAEVNVEIIVHFDKYLGRTPGGATIPSGFTKILRYDGNTRKYYFDNEEPYWKGSDSYKYYELN